MKTLRLFKRTAGNGSPYYIRFKCRRKAYLWSTKTSDPVLARKRGNDYREKVIAKEFGLVSRMNTVSSVATLGELIGAYMDLPSPTLATRRINVHAMRALMDANNLTETDRLDRIDKQTVLRFQQKCVSLYPNSQSAIVTCNSRVRCARSIFSKRALASYSITVPDETVSAFFRVPALREAEPRRELPSDEADAKAHADLPSRPEHYRAFLLARYAGLRAGEILAARRDWLEGCRLYVGGKTDQFITKGRKWRMVELPLRVAELLTQSDDPIYLVGPNRVLVVRRELPALLQGLGFPKSKPVHAARRLFGSMVYTEQGPRQARDALGHSTQAVTDRHYARSLDTPKALRYAG